MFTTHCVPCLRSPQNSLRLQHTKGDEWGSHLAPFPIVLAMYVQLHFIEKMINARALASWKIRGCRQAALQYYEGDADCETAIAGAKAGD